MCPGKVEKFGTRTKLQIHTKPHNLLAGPQRSCWTPDVLTLSAGPPSTAAQSSFLWKCFQIHRDPHPLQARRSPPCLPSPSDTNVRSPAPKEHRLLLSQNKNTEWLAQNPEDVGSCAWKSLMKVSKAINDPCSSHSQAAQTAALAVSVLEPLH